MRYYWQLHLYNSTFLQLRRNMKLLPSDREIVGKCLFRIEENVINKIFTMVDTNSWVFVEPDGSVKVKKIWTGKEFDHIKLISFWVISLDGNTQGSKKKQLFSNNNMIKIANSQKSTMKFRLDYPSRIFLYQCR